MEHTAPALCADGGRRGDGFIGYCAVCKDFVQIGGVGFAKESAGAVHAHDNHMLIHIGLFFILTCGSGYCTRGRGYGRIRIFRLTSYERSHHGKNQQRGKPRFQFHDITPILLYFVKELYTIKLSHVNIRFII